MWQIIGKFLWWLLVSAQIFEKIDDDVPIIPRAKLFGNPDRSNPQLSSDGSQIGFMREWKGVLNIWVVPTVDVLNGVEMTNERPVTFETGRDLRGFSWSYLPSVLLYGQDQGGDELWSLESLDVSVKDAKPKLLGASKRGIKVSTMEEPSAFHPDEIAVGVYEEDTGYPDVYKLNMTSGDKSLVLKRNKFKSIFFDHDFKLRLTYNESDDAAEQYFTPVLDETTGEITGWTLYKTVKFEDTGVTHFLGFDLTNTEAYWRDSEGRDRANTKWIVESKSDVYPSRFYFYDRETKNVKLLFDTRPELSNYTFARMHSVEIPSRDGLIQLCYLTLPVSVDRSGSGTPTKPTSMVMLVHGGPWWRDEWGFGQKAQWLANRGHAVLQCNYRGSTGFGKAHLRASYGEWAGKMHDDLIDAVNWAVEKGVAHKDQVAISGGSYGGYAALVGLTFTPEVFACGVDVVGPSNLVTLISTIPPYWKPMYYSLVRRIGADPNTAEGKAKLESQSPLFRVDKIRRPLLIAQGANDPRVKQTESDQIVAAMRQAGIPVTYLLFPDEGHGFVRPQNMKAFQALSEKFLKTCLGGRYEPVLDSELKASSVNMTNFV